MKQITDGLSPPVNLAIAYAPRDVRERFALLLALDARFGSIIGSATEAMIAQIKIAWWRDALSAAPDQRPRGEPMLAALYAIDDPSLNDAVGQLADAWELLLADEHWSLQTVQSFARHRGEAIFRGYARLAGLGAPPLDAAERWALDDLRLMFGPRAPTLDAPYPILPKQRALRPLTILALSVRDISGPHMLWHAMTGR